jgi:hypothetical protein
MTDVQLFRSGAYESIDYQSFTIEVGVSEAMLAPLAEISVSPRESVSPAQSIRIQEDGTTIFEGETKSGGTKRARAPATVECDHLTADLWEETVSISVITPTDEDVLQAALSAADTSATLSYSGVATQLNDAYTVDNRSVKRIFRDMMDRTDRIWWVDPASDTITVAPKGNRGTWMTLDAASRGVSVESFDEGSVETVRNDVTVVGTGDESVVARQTDPTSIGTYGRRTGDSPYNVSYVTSGTEASAVAASLLQPDPVPEGVVNVAQNVGNVTEPLVNYTIDLTDDSKAINATDLLVSKQTIEQGRASLDVGGGAGASLAEYNRNRKSDSDITAPGSVYNSDRIADDAISSAKLVDLSVTEQKLADLAVATDKLQDSAVINGKLDDLSVSETKIQDDSIATPKLKAEAVTAAKILADTITANEIAAGTITALEIAADTITASEIAAGTITTTEIATDTITANNIDTLNLETTELSVGADADAQFNFETYTSGPSTTFSRLVPSMDGALQIGSSGARFSSVFANVGNFNNGISALDGTSAFAGAGVSNELRLQADGVDTSLVPSADSTGRIGTGDGTNPTNAVFAVHTHNFFEYSPAPVASDRSPGPNHIDTDELKASDWEDPPEYVRQRKVVTERDEDGAPIAFTHEPLDGPGVELGAMANYLLETCKFQQRRIESLEETVDDLEQRLSRLEKQM